MLRNFCPTAMESYFVVFWPILVKMAKEEKMLMQAQ